MQTLENNDIRNVVRENYGMVAEAENGCGCTPTCCGDNRTTQTVEDVSLALGYSNQDVTTVPDGANMGLGCGNPQAIASLKAGETVLDLGSGGGFDSFLAAKAVGETGKVIGVDMTPEMINKSRRNAEKAGANHVEFRLGEIENLPIADGVIDVIISNCVINLSPEKESVFGEAFRVLKPGGRLAISDVVATTELPDKVKQDLRLYTGCIGGASSIQTLEAILQATGFANICILAKDESKTFIRTWVPGSCIEDYITSATIEAVKPMNG